MGFRFRKSFRVAPGIRLNVSKSGFSSSIGGKGVTYNSKGRVTASVPGTGVSYTSGVGERSRGKKSSESGYGCLIFMLLIPFIIWPWLLLVAIPLGLLFLYLALRSR